MSKPTNTEHAFQNALDAASSATDRLAAACVAVLLRRAEFDGEPGPTEEEVAALTAKLGVFIKDQIGCEDWDDREPADVIADANEIAPSFSRPGA